MKRNRLISILNNRGIIEAISLSLTIILWELVSNFIVRNPGKLPSPYSILLAFCDIWEIIPLDIGISLLHFGIGIGAGAAMGIIVGMLMGWFRIVDRIMDPMVEILRPIPPLAWVPFAILWGGLTHYAAGFIVFIGAFFPILINTYTGFREVDKTYIDAARVLGCREEWKLIKFIALPFSLPFIATGIRIGMGVGWMCVVAAELFGVSKSGLGYRLFQVFWPLHMIDKLILYMIILGLVALLLDRLFRYFVEEKLFKWKRGIVIAK
ncbi:MAG: ABC transporter permease [Methanophagales archaeon]|nr:ABC transporter permease [Methanophagales archaeon]RLG36067.1 MAG: ABC transporter permease [Methanosarcinales archaeon]MCW3137584.1 ABC transporter permease [Methanophagales archaeon]MCW3139083.1 ABC transporter permease [Methanophagales archaeon]MCW7069285.1 ABC transporter permease [Methanophagales archaeon]